MQLHINGDDKGFEIRLQIDWRMFRGFLKALVLAIGAIATLLAAPEIAQLLGR